MDNSTDKKTLKEQLEGLSWYELMTSQPIIDMYGIIGGAADHTIVYCIHLQ